MGTQAYVGTARRTFQQALIHLLETDYGLLGSRRVLNLVAEDIQQLVDEFCYFYNRSLYADRMHLFETLVSVAVNHHHGECRSLIEQSAPPGGVP